MRQQLIGVDVGGTFTDAVAVRVGERAGEILATAKAPTDAAHLAPSLLESLDRVAQVLPPAAVDRVCLSTTLITNLIAQQRLPEVALLLIPGPGLPPAAYRLPGRVWTVGGAIDFRGREIAPLDVTALEAALADIRAAGLRRVAVVGKFSPRNPAHEQAVVARLEATGADVETMMGHTVTGELNFPRRAAATALTLAVRDPFRTFYAQIRQALAERGFTCPVVVLKGDGGTLPLAAMTDRPLESVFSGPAASAMGGLASQPAGTSFIVVDVGGTTTDLALVLDGVPLLASEGATLDGMPLPMRALAVRALPLGGDSTVALSDGDVVLLPTRAGPAACLGGPAPTLTDALRVLGLTTIGDGALARQALAAIGAPETVARQVVDQALDRVEAGIVDVFRAWRQEPAYRLWELRQRQQREQQRLSTVVATGAGAAPLAEALGRRLQAEVIVPAEAAVANALGAALARTTYATTLHADTERGRFEIAETGHSGPLSRPDMTLEDARVLTRTWMARRGRELGLEHPLDEAVEVLAEQFNHVEGWTTVGRIFDVRLVRRPGLLVPPGSLRGTP